MILLLIGICIAAAVVNQGTQVFGFAVINAIASFWSNGVMSNFRGDPYGAPDWAVNVSMVSTIVGLILFVIALLF